MSGGIMLAVLFGAALHASWNALMKAGRDKFMDAALITIGGAVIAVVALPFLAQPAPASWPCLAASALIHIAYYALVAAAYRTGDMSLAYPLMRGTAPLVVALLSGAILGERLGFGAWAGVVLISAGVAGLALANGRQARLAGNPAAFALLNALVIALYTFVDGTGARLSASPVAYTLWLEILTAIPFTAIALYRRPADLRAHLASRWQVGLIGGACTLGSYALALRP